MRESLYADRQTYPLLMSLCLSSCLHFSVCPVHKHSIRTHSRRSSTTRPSRTPSSPLVLDSFSHSQSTLQKQPTHDIGHTRGRTLVIPPGRSVYHSSFSPHRLDLALAHPCLCLCFFVIPTCWRAQLLLSSDQPTPPPSLSLSLALSLLPSLIVRLCISHPSHPTSSFSFITFLPAHSSHHSPSSHPSPTTTTSSSSFFSSIVIHPSSVLLHLSPHSLSFHCWPSIPLILDPSPISSYINILAVRLVPLPLFASILRS